jgi:deoxyribodipyrimidine photolyase-related protein
MTEQTPLRHLVLVLGDQLDPHSTVYQDFDPACDAVWMAEVPHEANHVPSGQPRIALFLAAMRHLRDALRGRGWTVHYRALGEHHAADLESALAEDLTRLRPQRVIALKPGEWRLARSLPEIAERAGVPWSERPDRCMVCEPQDFAEWAKGRKTLRQEHFYQWLRRREGVLMDGAKPLGGRWNFDADNRGHFDARGPGMLPAPLSFAPDSLTLTAIADVRHHFPDRPGDLDRFDWPVTPAQAEAALDDFIAHRLPLFGRYQDAMWQGEPWLYHARLSAAMNLRLLDPRRVIGAAVQALRDGHAPLASVEGFVRQVLGWREFVRGVYWLRMPGFADANALAADRPLPDFFWTGDTDMACLRDALGQTLRLGYAHHIQRLMVIGLYALLHGVKPHEIHAWFLAVYVDAVEWVELPNVLGMSQYADGGLMVSKPYAASGKYIQRMSNHCKTCRFDPGRATGTDACPFTTLYWDFLDRHRDRFSAHPRAALQWRSLERLSYEQIAEIRSAAARQRRVKSTVP